MMKRTLALIALLTFFSPFLAAQGWFEVVGKVVADPGPDPVSLTLELQPGPPSLTIDIRVEGLDFTGIDFAENIQLEGIFTLDGARATAIAPGGELSAKELTGIITDIYINPEDEDEREVTLLGGWVISVPVDATLKDLNGNPLDLIAAPHPDDDTVFRFGDFVKAEGEILAGWFTASEMTIVEEFVCPGGATLTHTSVLEPELYEDHEDFCLQKKGGFQGRARFTRTDWDDEGVSDATITVGRYTQNERHGLWITLFETGAVRLECFYQQDELLFGLLEVEGVLECPFIPFE